MQGLALLRAIGWCLAHAAWRHRQSELAPKDVFGATRIDWAAAASHEIVHGLHLRLKSGQLLLARGLSGTRMLSNAKSIYIYEAPGSGQEGPGRNRPRAKPVTSQTTERQGENIQVASLQ